MGGVYGEHLAAFPELIKIYEVFKMDPRVGGGYGERYNKRKVRGYWSWRKSGQTGIEGDLRVPFHQAVFWVQQYFLKNKVAVKQNDYIEVDDEVFQVVQNDNFVHEGGFYKCLMKEAAVLTDRQHANTDIESAIRGDY